MTLEIPLSPPVFIPRVFNDKSQIMQSLIAKITNLLQEQGYLVEADKKLDGCSFVANLLAIKAGYNLPRLKWLPYVDYLFFHFIEKSDLDLKQIHDAERAYVNSLFKTPRVLRLKMPNIVSIFISLQSFSIEQESYAQTKTLYDDYRGGEKHSVHLIDMQNKKIVNQGLEKVAVVGGGAYSFGKADPSNRVRSLIVNLAPCIFAD